MTTELVIAVATDGEGTEIHAKGCKHLSATKWLYGPGTIRVPKWSHTVPAAEYGETIAEVRTNWAVWNEGCWIDKTSGCATGGRGKSHPVPHDIYDRPEFETREELAKWVAERWVESTG